MAEAMLWETTQFQATELCGLCQVLHLPVPQSLHIHWEGWELSAFREKWDGGCVEWLLRGQGESVEKHRGVEGCRREWGPQRPWHMASIQLGCK